ncbi:MAG: hypothetical protein WC484_08500 [Candidatus Omnitrophota bacterium]
MTTSDYDLKVQIVLYSTQEYGKELKFTDEIKCPVGIVKGIGNDASILLDAPLSSGEVGTGYIQFVYPVYVKDYIDDGITLNLLGLGMFGEITIIQALKYYKRVERLSSLNDITNSFIITSKSEITDWRSIPIDTEYRVKRINKNALILGPLTGIGCNLESIESKRKKLKENAIKSLGIQLFVNHYWNHEFA